MSLQGAEDLCWQKQMGLSQNRHITGLPLWQNIDYNSGKESPKGQIRGNQ